MFLLVLATEEATSSEAPYYGRFWHQNQDRDKTLAPPPSSPGAFATKGPFFGAFFAAALAFPFWQHDVFRSHDLRQDAASWGNIRRRFCKRSGIVSRLLDTTYRTPGQIHKPKA